MEDQEKFYHELNKVEFVEKEVIQLPNRNEGKTIPYESDDFGTPIVETIKKSWLETFLKQQIYGSATYILRKTNVIKSKADANIHKGSLYGKQYFDTLEFKFSCLDTEIDNIKLQFILCYYNLVMRLIKKLGWYD